jgi:hypothetical protein
MYDLCNFTYTIAFSSLIMCCFAFAKYELGIWERKLYAFEYSYRLCS